MEECYADSPFSLPVARSTKRMTNSRAICAIEHTVIDVILDSLRIPDLEIHNVEVMHKDSLDMTEERTGRSSPERSATRRRRRTPLSSCTARTHSPTPASFSFRQCSGLEIPIILTGAMRPYEFRDTDATQNVIEALLASRMVDPGVYVAMHNRVLKFPGVDQRPASTHLRSERLKPSSRILNSEF